MATAQTEAALARARKASEAAMKKRMELQKDYKYSLHASSVVRAEIARNENTIYAYRRYAEFLKIVTPDGYETKDFFDDPKKLMEELDAMEQDNCFLMEAYEDLLSDDAKRTSQMENKVRTTETEIRDVQTKWDMVPVVTESREVLMNGSVMEQEALEAELRLLADRIMETYVNCFGKTANLTSILMLEKIENALEDLYVRIQYVKPSFVEDKQKIKDEQRIEKHRLELLEKKEAGQRLKMEQALARAKMPIKKRTGRPPIARYLPIMFHRKDPEVCEAEALERERIEKLLYGSDFD
jgi:hypothetical protein